MPRTVFAETVDAVNEAAATAPAGTLAVSGFVGPNPVTDEFKRWCWYAAGPLPEDWAERGAGVRPITYDGGTTWTQRGARRRLHRNMHRLAGGDPLLGTLTRIAVASDVLAVVFALAASVVAIAADRSAAPLVVLAWVGALSGRLARRARRRRAEKVSASA